MDLAPIIFALVTIGFFIALMRFRVIALKRPAGPRRHRTTYRKAHL